MIRTASRQLIYFALLIVPISVLTLGCQPGNRSICRSLAELADEKSDETGEPWQQALDKTLSEEEACVSYLDSIAERHGEKWREVSLCYARASNWSDVETCDKVVATLDVADICYHIVDLQEVGSESNRRADDNPEAGTNPGDEESSGEGAANETDREDELAPRSERLNACVETEREKYRESRDAYATYTECVMAAETLTAARECTVEDDSAEAPATDHSDDE